MKLTTNIPIRAALIKIERQFRTNNDIDKPFYKLQFAILKQTIMDSLVTTSSTLKPNEKKIYGGQATAYLARRTIPCCEICGVDSSWVRRILKRVRS